MNNSINDMISQLAYTREQMTEQCKTIGGIMQKSNNVLLQLEGSQSAVPLMPASGGDEQGLPTVFAKTTKQALANVLIKAQTTLRDSAADSPSAPPGQSSEQYLHNSRANVVYLDRSVRKFIALRDLVTHMKDALQMDENGEGDADNDDEEEMYDSSPEPQ